ncbi:MAG: hypothetical protein OYH77_02075 [Pseudomonadota bacterium]|nr:hypothetical protein [Pseudomonadota bacterium]
MLKKIIFGLLGAAVATSIYYRLQVNLPSSKAVPVALQIIDGAGGGVAGAAIGHWHADGEWQELGVSDTYGHWYGQVKLGTLLTISKSTAQGEYRAVHVHAMQNERALVSLKLSKGLRSFYPYRTDFAYEIASARLRPILTELSRKAGLVISALSLRKIEVVKIGKDWSVMATSVPDGQELYRFKVQTGYPLSVLAEKILLGIFQHTAQLYRSFYDERRAAWLLYNPAGFWRLQAGMRLTNAQGGNYTVVATTGSMVLEVLADADICRGYECQLYANHQRQAYY